MVRIRAIDAQADQIRKLLGAREWWLTQRLWLSLKELQEFHAQAYKTSSYTSCQYLVHACTNLLGLDGYFAVLYRDGHATSAFGPFGSSPFGLCVPHAPSSTTPTGGHRWAALTSA